MDIIISILIFVFGLLVGSFLNVVICRFPNLKSIAIGRSECPKCKKQLKWYDLIPVLSYIILRGRCRNCHKPISVQYPIVELSTALMLLAIYLNFGLSQILFPLIIIGLISIVIFVQDMISMEVYDIFPIILIIFSLAAGIFLNDYSWQTVLYGGIFAGGAIGFLVLISREAWMGAGDIGIAFAFGSLLGLNRSIVFFMLSFIIGAIVGLVLIAFAGKDGKTAVPFAPFMIISAFFCLFYGQIIVNYYFNLISY